MRTFILILITFVLLSTAAVAQSNIPPADAETIYIPFPNTIELDGDLSDWEGIPSTLVETGIKLSDDPAENGSFTLWLTADESHIYVAMTMPDKTIISGQHEGNYWNEDSFEFYFNLTDDLDAGSYSEGVYQIRMIPADIGVAPDSLTITGVGSSRADVLGTVFETDDGWGVEASFALEEPVVEHGRSIGFQAQANGASAASVDRNVKLSWSAYDTNDTSWGNPSLFGTAVFFENGASDVPEPIERNPTIPEPAAEVTAPSLRLNQTGYYPTAPKFGMFGSELTEPIVWGLWSGDELITVGETALFGEDELSGETVHQIDFTDFETEGEYQLLVDGKRSVPFTIGTDIYSELKSDALSYFYQSRSGVEIEAAYVITDAYARPAGYESDNNVTCYEGTAADGSSWDGCDYFLDASKGWFDAGDYGKYVVNSGISVWTLLNMYERNPDSYGDGSLRIPENDNGVPDILDEVRWNLEFMLGMQAPADDERWGGMAHHKLHGLEWEGLPLMPHTEVDNTSLEGRYLMPPSTAATLNLAANAAQCARIYEPFDDDFAERCLEAAERAWTAANDKPMMVYGNIPGQGGGNYDDDNVTDEFYWAAAELYLTTGDDKYLEFIQSTDDYLGIDRGVSGMYWGETQALGTISLALLGEGLGEDDIIEARGSVVAAANRYKAQMESNGYRIPIFKFDWGSNSSVSNNMLMLGLAYEFTGDETYLGLMAEGMDYLLGRNPTGYSFVSQYGEVASQFPHHRFWANQGDFPPPPPGVIAGGVNENVQDPTAMDAGLLDVAPAKRYVDNTGSYSTNEVTINWNSPLAWVATALDEYYNGIVPERPLSVSRAAVSKMALEITELSEEEPEPTVEPTSESAPEPTSESSEPEVEPTEAPSEPADDTDEADDESSSNEGGNPFWWILLAVIGVGVLGIIVARLRKNGE